ncbi:hypothetical protein [Paracoccus denitrificans]|uniref:hypothetical protein n=1 Tax=Paracoccus denitrificans TaxID=266 RepID=UPI003364FEB3
MSRKFRNLGQETFDFVETAPIPLLREILEYRSSDSEPEIAIDWPTTDNEEEWRAALLTRLDGYPADDLRPVEDRCRRIRSLAVGKGPTSLEHVALDRRSHEEIEELHTQPDALCRSAWLFLRHPEDFEDAEAFHAARQYRDFGKMYDSFEAIAGTADRIDAEKIDEEALAALLTAKLELPSRVTIRSIDLPATQTHPASVMVIVRHGGPLSSVLNYKNNGVRSPIYFRPPNEATLIWTPAERAIEVCGPAPKVRKVLGDVFAEVVLKTDLSSKPLSWRRYDLSRFRKSLILPLPSWDDVDVSAARLIEVELRLGNWSRRLSLRVTIDDDIEAVAQRYLGGDRILKHAEGFSRLAAAVHYSRPGDRKERSLEISFGDTRSNLQSKTDPQQRDLGYRLLQFWGILDRLQVLDDREVSQCLPALLALHDLPEDEIGGGMIRQHGLDPKRLMQAGVLELRKKQNVVLLDDDDDFGDVTIGAMTGRGQAEASGLHGEELGNVPLEDIRQYVIRREWLEEIVVTALKPLIGRVGADQLDGDLLYLGRWRTPEAEIPIYFARRLDQAKTLSRLDVILRSRQDGGIGIVLTAAPTPFSHLGPNVVMPLGDLLSNGKTDEAAQSAMLERFKIGRWLALGGSEVTLARFGSSSAMLYIPGLAPLPVSGTKQMLIVERLVAAYQLGATEVRTGVLTEGTGVKSPKDAWPSNARHTVAGVYFENHRQNFWRLKTDHLPRAT